nr:calcium/proton exchanger [Tanacetum cinerariifolium]
MADDEGNESNDTYCSSDEEDLSYVDFHTKVDDNVVIKTVTTNDHFLNKLCVDSAQFINLVDEPMNPMGINYDVIGMIEGIEDEETESEEMTEDEIRNHLEHDYMEEVLLEEEQKREAYQTEHNEFDQEPLRHTLEEEAMKKNHLIMNHTTGISLLLMQMCILKNQLSKHECRGEIGFRLGDFEAEDNHKSHVELEIPSAEPIAVVTPSVDKWKQHAEPREKPDLKPQAKKRG